MALILVPETGLGLPAATENTYVSRAEADTYNSDRGRDVWSDLDGEVKDIHLLISAQQMEARYRTLWKGKKRLSDNDADNPTANDPLIQALSWPRKDVKDEDGVALDRALIPILVKHAQIEIAFAISEGAEFLQAEINTAESKIKSETVGPIKTEFFENQLTQSTFPFIDQMLEPLTGGVPTVKLGAHVSITQAEALDIAKGEADFFDINDPRWRDFFTQI